MKLTQYCGGWNLFTFMNLIEFFFIDFLLDAISDDVPSYEMCKREESCLL